MRSTKTFFSSTISSPAGDRIAWKIRREASGQSAQTSGTTIVSM